MKAFCAAALFMLSLLATWPASATEQTWKGLQPNPRLCDGKPLLPVEASQPDAAVLTQVIVKPGTKLYADPTCNRHTRACMSRVTLNPRNFVAAAGACKTRLLVVSAKSDDGNPFAPHWINRDTVASYRTDETELGKADWLGLWSSPSPASDDKRKSTKTGLNQLFHLRIEPYDNELLVSVLMSSDDTDPQTTEPVTSVVSLFSGRPADKAAALLSATAIQIPGRFPCAFSALQLQQHIIVATDGLSCYKYAGIYTRVNNSSIHH